MSYKDHLYYLKRCIEISKKAKNEGNMPFGSLIVDKEGNIIVEQGNIEVTENICTGHAETTAMMKASKQYPKDILWGCTLYTTAEPCSMCSGAIYWGNVGRVVYGINEKKLLELTGNSDMNPTFDLPCREIFAKGQKKIEVIGPFPEIEEEVVAVHKDFWK
ncbi:tRNA-specific adenosine deaminase [Bacillus sp. 7586-K]|uniref:nucleoside deaminase n=1 Tax=Metabacillus niabensis TaxID=324854 RepID=UPI000BA7722D|nr:tRNA-specific adenosine deaminase [Bacillus sp. 7586-K]